MSNKETQVVYPNKNCSYSNLLYTLLDLSKFIIKSFLFLVSFLALIFFIFVLFFFPFKFFSKMGKLETDFHKLYRSNLENDLKIKELKELNESLNESLKEKTTDSIIGRLEDQMNTNLNSLKDQMNTNLNSLEDQMNTNLNNLDKKIISLSSASKKLSNYVFSSNEGVLKFLLKQKEIEGLVSRMEKLKNEMGEIKETKKIGNQKKVEKTNEQEGETNNREEAN